MSALLHDLRHALRVLARERGATAVAVLTLALGIGASTAIFTVVDNVLLRPLPYPEPDRLVQLVELSDKGDVMNVPEANFVDWRDQSRSFARMALHTRTSVRTLSGGTQPVRAGVVEVGEGFFDVLGVGARTGRGFRADDHARGAARVALVSHVFWQRALGGKTDLGGLVLRDGERTTPVVGVMPPGFSYPPGAEVWLASEPSGELNPSRSAHNYSVLARLAPGVSTAAAAAELGAIARRIHGAYADVTAVDATAIPLKSRMTGAVRPALLVLLGAVGVLLLVACANVTNLLLAQATARRRELALRSALGASRARLLLQSVTESTLLAVLGGVLGILLSVWGVDAMLALGSDRLPRSAEIAVDARVLAFGLGVSLLTGVVVGAVLAWRSTRGDLQDALREGGRTGTAAGHRSARDVLVVAQVAMTLALLVGSGLLARSFVKALHEDLGFQAGGQLTADLLLPEPEDEAGRLRLARFHRELQQRVAALPGVLASGGINDLPLTGRGANGRFKIEGRGDSGEYWPTYVVASPGYFAAVGIPLLAGRLLADSDGPAAPHAAVISRQVAERVFPGEDPIGKRINTGNMDGDHEHWITIVGVVGDVRSRGPELGPRGAIYVHDQQRPQRTATFTTVIRTAGDPRALIPAVRRHVQALDPELPVVFRTLEEQVSSVLADRRFNLTLIAAFGGTALLIALLGIYGVVSYSVAQRTREIGIRMALGAPRRRVIGQFLGEGGRLVALGIAIGLAASAALGRTLQSLLYGTSAHDPLTYAGVAAALALVALVACLIPARRATRVDPMVALRRE